MKWFGGQKQPAQTAGRRGKYSDEFRAADSHAARQKLAETRELNAESAELTPARSARDLTSREQNSVHENRQADVNLTREKFARAPREPSASAGEFRSARRDNLVQSEPARFQRGATLRTWQREHDPGEPLERQKEKALRARRRKIGLVFGAILAICAAGLVLLIQFAGTISSVTSNAPNLTKTDQAEYVKIAREYLAANPFERFSFARRDDNLTKYMEQQAPEIAAVKISVAGVAQIKLNLTFREPVASWSTGGQTDYVDNQGVVFSRNYFAAPGVAITDDSGVETAAGSQTSTRFLMFVGSVMSDLKKQGIQVDRAVIPPGAIRYVDFYLSGRAYPFKAQIDRDAAGQAADIAAMAKYLDAQGITPSYVDCRVSDRAYWK
jgi:hypothetical protein